MNPEYRFCNSKGIVETLVLLKDYSTLPNLIYFQIDSLDAQDFAKKSDEIGKKNFYFPTILHAKRRLEKEKNIPYVVILSTELHLEKGKIDQFLNVHQLIYYSSQKTLDKEMKKSALQDQAIVSCKKDVLKRLEEYNSSQYIYKILPNFLFLETQIGTSHVLLRSIHSMLNQKIDSCTYDQINQQFQKLLQGYLKIDKSIEVQILEDKDWFFKDLQNGMMQQGNRKIDKKKIIEWYTKNTFVYKVINNILRTHRNPTEIFYISHYFKLLFQTIRQLYEESQKIQGPHFKFTCFRGGKMSDQEFHQFLRNEGKVVQNLGFISTSKSFDIALKFLPTNNTRVMYIIKVDQKAGISETGFANIKNMSQYFGEEEILFNPLCSFEVISVKKKGNGFRQFLLEYQYQIVLKHVVLRKHKNKKQRDKKCKDAIQNKIKKDQLKERIRQNKYIKIGKLQYYERLKNNCQGNSLSNQFYIKEEAKQYWQKYILMTKPKRQIPIDFTRKLCWAYGEFHLFYISLVQNKRPLTYNDFNWLYILISLFGKNELYQKLISQINSVIQGKKGIRKEIIESIERYENQSLYIASKTISKLKERYEYNFFLKFQFNQFSNVKKQKYVITHQIKLENRKISVSLISRLNFKEEITQVSLNNNIISRIDGRVLKFQNTQKLNLSQNTISNISQSFLKLKKLEELNLSNNKIKALSEVFSKLQNIVKLNLSQNGLADAAQVFSLNKLQVLDLGGNQISQIPQQINNLNKLKKLDFKNNLIQRIEKLELSTLEEFDVSGNLIYEISQGMFQFNGYKINMSNNQLISLHNSINIGGNIVDFDLSNNLLEEIPEKIWCLKYLQRLNLQQNLLLVFPYEKVKLKNLVSLQLGNNLLQKIKILGDNMENLQYLCLKNNQLSKVQLTFEKVKPKISKIDISNNYLQVIPTDILKLQLLRQVNLSNNKISFVPSGLENLRDLDLSNNSIEEVTSLLTQNKIERLNLKKNIIKQISTEIQKMRCLKQINLSENQIQELPNKFHKMRSLKELIVSSNKLIKLPSTLSPYLQRLIASNNKIFQIPDEIFKIKSLIEVDFARNNIQRISKQVSKLTNLKSFNISGNPIEVEQIKILPIRKIVFVEKDRKTYHDQDM